MTGLSWSKRREATVNQNCWGSHCWVFFCCCWKEVDERTNMKPGFAYQSLYDQNIVIHRWQYSHLCRVSSTILRPLVSFLSPPHSAYTITAVTVRWPAAELCKPKCDRLPHLPPQQPLQCNQMYQYPSKQCERLDLEEGKEGGALPVP